MMHLRGLVLFLLCLAGGARRSMRINDSHQDEQQQISMLANGLEVSGEAREAFIPGGFVTGTFGRAGPQTGASKVGLAPSSRAVPEMMAPKRPASPTKPVVPKRARPLSPGSNYPTTKNIQEQRSGFGTWVQKFQLAGGKSKYGVPIFLPNGNVNPKYLAAERADIQKQSKRNTAAAEAKRKKLIAEKKFQLADYIRKAIGTVGSGKEYYQSGK